MLDFGFSEILLTSAIALVVLGPERLPKVARQVGNWMGRARAMARQLTEQLEREVSADELMREQSKAPAPNRFTPPAVAAPPPATIPATITPATTTPSTTTPSTTTPTAKIPAAAISTGEAAVVPEAAIFNSVRHPALSPDGATAMPELQVAPGPELRIAPGAEVSKPPHD